jgi:predicted TPR repeat methyltransferase
LLDILDLGCGTGLCGQLLRPLARTLTGIDLAPAMVEKSRSRGVYDRLELGELLGFLQTVGKNFDLLVGADVFIYVGDLLPLFEASAAALRAGGWMVFSVEACGGERFRLQSSQRFAHSMPYVEKIASICGFELVSCRPIAIRMEAGNPVAGFLVMLRLPLANDPAAHTVETV